MRGASGSFGSAAYDPQVSAVGSGRPLIFVPGMDGTGRLFYRQQPLLSRRFRVITYRLRDDAEEMETLIQDLTRIIEPIGSALILGESFGGALAMSFALARPELVAALVVLNSFPYFAPRVRLQLAIGVLESLPFPWQVMGAVRRLTAFRLHSKFTHRAELRRFLELTRDTTRRGYIGRLKMLERYDVRDRLREIRVPTLYLAAERDHLVPSVRQAELMAARVPGATLRVLPGHGHICLLAPNLDLSEILREWNRA